MRRPTGDVRDVMHLPVDGRKERMLTIIDGEISEISEELTVCRGPDRS